MGKFGIGERNDRGEILVNFAERYDFRIMNTFFQKRDGCKWTLRATKNGIDFIIRNKNNSTVLVMLL